MEDKIYEVNDYIKEKQDNSYHEIVNSDLDSLLWRLLIGLVVYNLLVQIVAKFIPKSLGLGVIMMISTIVSLFVLIGIVKRKSIVKIVSHDYKSHSFLDIIYFFGLMIISNLVFGLISKKIMELLNISSPDVMDIVMSSFTPISLIYIVLVGPFIEEVIYRGVLLQNLGDYSKKAALLISTFAFAFMHGYFSQSFQVLGLSFVLNYIGYFYSWKFAFIMHLINNLNSMVISLLMVHLGEESTYLYIISLLIIIAMIYAINRFFRTGRKDFMQNMKSDINDQKNFRKIVFSPQMIALLLFYITMMILTEIYV